MKKLVVLVYFELCVLEDVTQGTFSCIDNFAGIMPIITCPSCNSTNTRFFYEKGFVENTCFCRKTGFVANTCLWGFVWCRLLRRHLRFDFDFAQITGLNLGG